MKMLANKGSTYVVSENSIQYDINKKSRLKQSKNPDNPSLEVRKQNTESAHHLAADARRHSRLNLTTAVFIFEEDASPRRPKNASSNVKIQDASNDAAGPRR